MRTKTEFWLSIALTVLITAFALHNLRKPRVLTAIHNGTIINDVVEVWVWE